MVFKKSHIIAILILLGIITAKNPIFSGIIILGIIFIYALYKKPLYGIIISIFFAILGELGRLPLGPENGILINDIFLPFFGAIWLIKKLKEKSFKKSELLLPATIFIIISGISLLNSFRYIEFSESLQSSLYLARFISYFLLYIITIDICKNDKTKKTILNYLFIGSFLIAILGFIQLAVYPDFKEMSENYGWDPHEGRLLSTWFDPNFVGGFFAFIISISTSIILYSKSKKTKISLGFLILILLAALFYTYSRSAYLACAGGIFLIGIIKSRKLILACFVIGILLIPLSDRAKERIGGMVNSAKSIVGIGTEVADPTSQLRLQSWQNSITIVKKYFVLGTGYNTLRYIQQKEGIIEDATIHSASGSDSSLLTVFMTTGIFGLFAFLWIYYKILTTCIKILNQKNSLNKGLAMGMLSGIFALFIHSFFVNSLLFSPMLVFIWIFASLNENAISPKQIHRFQE